MLPFYVYTILQVLNLIILEQIVSQSLHIHKFLPLMPNGPMGFLLKQSLFKVLSAEPLRFTNAKWTDLHRRKY